VAQVHLSTTGKVLSVDVLEAPSLQVSASVSTAVRQWEFESPELISGRPQLLSAKLTFYVVRDGEHCLVLYPSEAGYVGRYPTTERGRRTVDGGS